MPQGSHIQEGSTVIGSRESPTELSCDACEQSPGTPYPPLPALALCGPCTELLTEYARGDPYHRRRWSGRVKLDAYKLGTLEALFATERGRRKLERIARSLNAA